jgi:phosphatidylcholine synthase
MQTPRWLNAFLIVIFSALVFVPLKYLYPSRGPVLRGLTIGLGTVWAVMVFVIIYQIPEPSPFLVFGSLLFPVYYLGLSFWLEIRKRQQR